LITTFAEAVEGALERRGLGDIWWGARVLEAWPHVVGTRYAKRSRPFLDKSALHERGLLTIAVQNSSWMHALSFLDIADRMNDELGKKLIRKVRFELREVLP